MPVQQETVIITGAGASIPYGMPSTRELRDRIIINIHQIKRWFKKQRQDRSRPTESEQLVNQFKKDLLGSYTESIDQFLNNRREYADLGKLAIAYQIIQHHHDGLEETRSGFRRVSHSESPAKIPQTIEGLWLHYLMNRMADDCLSAKDFRRRCVNFITFNYDRVIELAINSVLHHRFGDTKTSPWEWDENGPFSVEHVYGAVKLPSPSNSGNSDCLLDLAKQCSRDINIIRSGKDSPEMARETQDRLTPLLKNASRVIVIGFGWHPDNIRQIPWSAIPKEASVHFGIYGVPSPVWERAKSVLHRAEFKRPMCPASDRLAYPEMRNNPVRLHKVDALELLSEELNLHSS